MATLGGGCEALQAERVRGDRRIHAARLWCDHLRGRSAAALRRTGCKDGLVVVAAGSEHGLIDARV